ncbi:ATP-dependent DNA helicase PIF1-like protein [Tanacetum coccineum]
MRGRIVSANPAEGERFYLRVLLQHVKGPTGFDYHYTFNGVLHSMIRRVSLERELIKSDDYIHACLRVFFIDGPRGSGKTFLYKALLATVRSRGLIALATASSGDSMEEEDVSLVDGVFEGAFGALALEMEALVDAMDVYGG